MWGINYWPEVAGIAPFNRGMCRFLAGRGHQVRMVSTFSYYPAWRKDAEDRFRIFRTDLVDGIPVHRCWHFVPARATTLRRIVHELSFGITSFLRILSLPRADIYIVVSPPLILGPLAWAACMLKRSRYVFHVQDLQPDAAVGLGMMKARGFMARILHRMAGRTYRNAVLVSGISSSMIDAFAEKRVPAEKRYWFPNWIEGGQSERRTTETADWRARYGIPDEAFLASYSGNLGRKQGLDVLLDAAEMLATQEIVADTNDPNRYWPIVFVIAGDGVMRPELEARLKRRPLPNLRLLPLLSEADYQAMLSSANACLITQAKGTGRFFLPSKLLSALVAGRAVVAVADETSELARAVREGNFGVVVQPEDPGAVAGALSDLAAHPAKLVEFGLNGRRWVAQFDAATVLGKFEERLREVAC